ncbi:ROK family protein [Microbacterium sp. B2969]|uniref:ROK family protein n=1 Tax=Microbacterium alkaliflavum TaxID=3248839 RepID=A0ABW7Q2E8_9MICO
MGRPTQLLDVDADAYRFVGIKLREKEVITALTNLRGAILRMTTMPIVATDPESVVRVLADQVREIAGAHEIGAIGIGVGARVSGRAHIVSARFLGWRDVPLAALLAEATGIPTVVENDVLAFTEYQHWFGEARHDDRFAVVSLGAGTGFGLVANGALVVGDDYGIGLVGHWPLDPNGPMCPNGHRGCATSMLNSDAISRRVSEALGSSTDYDAAIALAVEGQPAARRIADEAGRGLGRLLAAICNLTMPQHIILAGEGVALATVAMDAIIDGIRADRDPNATTPPIIVTNGDNAEWCQGAAALAVQAFVGGAPLT